MSNADECFAMGQIAMEQATRIRELGAEVARLREQRDAALDVIDGVRPSLDGTHVRVAISRMDRLRAALAQAEPDPDDERTQDDQWIDSGERELPEPEELSDEPSAEEECPNCGGTGSIIETVPGHHPNCSGVCDWRCPVPEQEQRPCGSCAAVSSAAMAEEKP